MRPAITGKAKIGLLAIGMFALAITRSSWLPAFAHWLNVSCPNLPSKYAIPLPGGNDTRPFAAAALVEAGHAERAVVLRNTVTPNESSGLAMPMHEVTRRVLIQQGVTPEKIETLEGLSTSTLTDMRIISTIWEKHPDATVLIVTDPSHTRRARWAARRTLGDYYHKVSFVASVNDSFYENGWWQSEIGFQTVSSEYLKLAFYVVFYSSAKQRIACATLILVLITACSVVLWRSRARRRHRSTETSTSPSNCERNV